jgi:hypothetical protein
VTTGIKKRLTVWAVFVSGFTPDGGREELLRIGPVAAVRAPCLNST